ncbi:ATP-dependent nuclease [Sphingomicrobium arenosum]|uniref:ATP-dependent nuclease n=1 Tax=Sphingomicrobium arenosum TaxID=2233861 RepID=UPI00223FA830|nr:ATP-dependent endonuclease [Sphingomicrobium arenosum]
MRLAHARIKNFRAISDISVDFSDHTVFVGANGVGKSSILKAVGKFFDKSPQISIEDFHERKTDQPIEIVLTFEDLSPEEAEEFGSRVHSGRLVVSRIFEAGSRDNGRYYGQSLQHPELAAIRAIDNGTRRRSAFNALCEQAGLEGLERAANAQELEHNASAWEAANPDQCELVRDDGQFLGFTNVARGALNKYLSFVFVPAVRDGVKDATDNKGSVIGQLIELVVKSVVEKRKDIRDWQQRASEEYKNLVSPENLGELGTLSGELSQTLGIFYGDSKVDLNWKDPEDFQVALPLADVLLTEGGYTGPLSNKGHGLQRAFIFTLLQHLAKALSARTEDDSEEDAAPVGPHNVILAIEEPELYQHPIKQRHVANVLRSISEGQIEGVMSRTQVMVCSHSPHFVSTEHFDEVRLTRRCEVEDEGASCEVKRLTYGIVNAALDGAYAVEEGGHDDASLKARLHVINEGVSEGFFCEAAVVVEGAGDRAALLAVAKAKKVDLTAMGVAILPVGGKGNIDKAVAIFSRFGIPTYAVFDSDGDKNTDDQHLEQNRAIQYLSGEENPVDVRTFVSDNFASFETNLNKVLKSELGQSYDDQAELLGLSMGMKPSRAVKNPVVLSQIVRNCIDQGGNCETVGEIVDRIVELRSKAAT